MVSDEPPGNLGGTPGTAERPAGVEIAQIVAALAQPQATSRHLSSYIDRSHLPIACRHYHNQKGVRSTRLRERASAGRLRRRSPVVVGHSAQCISAQRISRIFYHPASGRLWSVDLRDPTGSRKLRFTMNVAQLARHAGVGRVVARAWLNNDVTRKLQPAKREALERAFGELAGSGAVALEAAPTGTLRRLLERRSSAG